MKKFWLSLAFLPLLFLAGCPKPAAPPTRPTSTDSRPAQTTSSRPTISATVNEPMAVVGNPDGATVSPSNKEHFLMRRPQFDLSYNDKLRFPNWVAWHLVASDIGDTERGNFVPDPDLPDGFEKITTRDYVKSGYDRGHNCPSKDRTASKADNDVAFYMTNITPQQHGMNAGPWEGLESYCRSLAREGNELYIVCGHGFRDKNNKTIGTDGIAVPDFGWKIVVVLPEKKGNDLERVSEATRIIAVEMPNISTISHQPWDNYIKTVADIELSTGLTFFENLPSSLARALKQKRDEGANSFTSAESGFRKSKKRSGGNGSSGFTGGRR